MIAINIIDITTIIIIIDCFQILYLGSWSVHPRLCDSKSCRSNSSKS